MNASCHLPSLIVEATKKLRDRCGDRAVFEARLLLGIATGSDEAVYPHMRVQPTEQQIAHYDTLIAQRCAGKPISRIRGWREFWSLRFYLNSATLDPRPESELLIDKAISFAESQHITQNQQFRVLDLGTGSGCLLLACLSAIKHATGVGIDINEQAIIQAQMNARSLNLEARSEFFVSNWFDGLGDNSFDMVLCNPPYIPTEDEASLQDEVRLFDPKQALFSHNQGLADYEIIFASLEGYLNPNGIACVEIGHKQSEQVMELACRFNLNVREVLPDLQGIPRCLVLCH